MPSLTPLPWHTRRLHRQLPLSCLQLHRDSEDDLARQCPPTFSMCRVLHGGSWGALLWSPSMLHNDRKCLLSSTDQSSGFAVCGGINLSWVLCKDFQINRCWLCQWDTLFYWIPARTSTRPTLTTSFALKKWQTQWGGQEQERLFTDVVWKHLFCDFCSQNDNKWIL